MSISFSHRIPTAMVGLVGEQGIGLKPTFCFNINMIGLETKRRGEVNKETSSHGTDQIRGPVCSQHHPKLAKAVSITPHHDDDGIIGGGLSTEGRSGTQTQDWLPPRLKH